MSVGESDRSAMRLVLVVGVLFALVTVGAAHAQEGFVAVTLAAQELDIGVEHSRRRQLIEEPDAHGQICQQLVERVLVSSD